MKSVRISLREINIVIQQGCIKLDKIDSKYIYNVPKHFYIKLLFWIFYLSTTPKIF